MILTLLVIKYFVEKEISWFKNSLNLPIFLFVLVMSLSLLRVNTIRVSLRDYEIFISYFLLYFLIYNNINEENQFDSFVKLFFIISLIVALYTLMQYYGLDPYLKELKRLSSTIGQKNWISNYLTLIFPIIFSYFLLQKIRRNKIFLFLLLSIVYTTLMICQSRGIWISISLTLLIGIFFISKFKIVRTFQNNRKWLFLLLLTFLLITIIYSTDNPLNKSAITVVQRAVSTFDEQDPSINTRLLIWRTTLQMIKEKPLLGLGIGTFEMNYLDYQAEFLKRNPYYIKYSGKAREAHNEYLQMWAELGLVGLGVFLSIIFVFYNLIINYFKKEHNDKKRITVLGLLMGITCFLIHSLFTFPLHVPALGSAFFVIMSLTMVYIGNFNLSEVKKEKIVKKIQLKFLKLKVNYIILVLVLVIMLIAIDFLVIRPYTAEIYYFKGVRYNKDSNYTDALPNFDYAAQLDPYNGRILHALGTTYYNLNMQSEAEEILQKSKNYINDRNLFRNLGLSYMQTGNYEKAEIELKHAIYLDPKFTEAYVDLAYLFAIQKDYDKAIVEWKKILEVDPNFSEKYNVLYFIGLTYQKKEMHDKALEYFLQALRLAPEDSPIMENIEEEIYNIYKGNLYH
jgi:O-antigen ligase/Flp pilus assembly protein TadD